MHSSILSNGGMVVVHFRTHGHKKAFRKGLAELEEKTGFRFTGKNQARVPRSLISHLDHLRKHFSVDHKSDPLAKD